MTKCNAYLMCSGGICCILIILISICGHSTKVLVSTDGYLCRCIKALHTQIWIFRFCNIFFIFDVTASEKCSEWIFHQIEGIYISFALLKDTNFVKGQQKGWWCHLSICLVAPEDTEMKCITGDLKWRPLAWKSIKLQNAY